MASLILLNGPPASGKSTLAQRYADDHPLTLNLDVDRVRAMIGGWQDDLGSAGVLARAVVAAAASVHLVSGHDVVVPQLLAKLDFIHQLEAVATEVGADFADVMLHPDEMGALRLYHERAYASAAPALSDPVVSTDKTDVELGAVYAQLLDVLAARPSTPVIRVQPGRVAEAYQALLDILGRP